MWCTPQVTAAFPLVEFLNCVLGHLSPSCDCCLRASPLSVSTGPHGLSTTWCQFTVSIHRVYCSKCSLEPKIHITSVTCRWLMLHIHQLYIQILNNSERSARFYLNCAHIFFSLYCASVYSK